MGRRRNVVPHERRVTSRGAGGETLTGFPSRPPLPGGSWLFYRPACGDWNQFILLGPEPFELVLQTGRVPARAGGRGNPMHALRPFRTGSQRPQEPVEPAEPAEPV